jgi:hypothetical protein
MDWSPNLIIGHQIREKKDLFEALASVVVVYMYFIEESIGSIISILLIVGFFMVF